MPRENVDPTSIPPIKKQINSPVGDSSKNPAKQIGSFHEINF